MKKILPILLAGLLLGSGLVLPPALPAAATQSSYASWFDANTTDLMGHINFYTLPVGTTLSLYRVNTENTNINTLVQTYGPSTVANQPFHYPVLAGPYGNAPYNFPGNGALQGFYKLVANNGGVPNTTNLVNWDLNSPDYADYMDSHTFLVGDTGTYSGSLFHTWLFARWNSGGYLEGWNEYGMSLGVINNGSAAINVQVNRWNGAAWVAAPASFTGNNVAGLAAGKIWMYGGTPAGNEGDYQVVVTGGTALVYKGSMFELDHDNSFTTCPDANGSKVGTEIYGAMSALTYGSNPGNLVVTSSGGASTVDVYTYDYPGFPGAMTSPRFPADPSGNWTLWAAAVNVPANGSVALSPGMNGLPALNQAGTNAGQFIKVVVTGGAPVQVEAGANILAGTAGDGDWLAAADTQQALGRVFYPTNGNYNPGILTPADDNNARIVVMAPSVGTSVTVSSPGKPNQTWGPSTTVDQAHSFPVDYAVAGDLNRVWTVTSDKNVYCFYETAGTDHNKMEKMYSAVAPVPGVSLQISKQVDKLQVDPGGNLTYTLIVQNVGSADATNLEIWDTLPAGLVMPPVSDSLLGNNIEAGVPGVSPRKWLVPSLAAAGGAVTVTLVVQVDPAQPVGSMVFANRASTFASNAPAYIITDPVVSFAVAHTDGCREAWATWENNPVSGSHQEGFVHIWAQRDGTTVTLSDATNLDAGAPPMAINNILATVNLNAGESYSYPGDQGAVSGGGGGFNTRFFKVESNYPVSWEIESQNVPDRMGHQMMVNSVDGRFADSQPFFTYMDYYHKDCGGPPKCWDNSRYGDALVVVNPNTGAGQSAAFQAFNSFDDGATWNFAGDYSVAPESAVLIGGTTQATAGDYLVIPYLDATSQGLDLIVYKGSSINRTSETQNSGGLYGVAEDGSKAADAGAAIYGLAGTGGGPNIVVTSLAAGTTAQIYQYTPTIVLGADWPLAGNSGTWAPVGAALGPLALGAGASYSTTADGLYKVEVTAGSAQALFGSNIFTNFSYGDGDMLASLDNRAADWLSSQGTTIFKGSDFLFTSGGQAGGNIQVIAPNAGTSVQITGGSINTGGGSGRTISASPPPSSVDDQAWRFELSQANMAYRITASDEVMVIYQDRGNDHVAKAYAGMPLILCVDLSPTPTATSTATATATPTFTITPTATPSDTLTATPTATVTMSSTSSQTETYTSTVTPTVTLTDTPTETNTFSATYTPTYTVTLTPTPTFTITVTPTVTRTITEGPTPTWTVTPTNTDTVTVTSTITFTATLTATRTITETPTDTYTLTATPTVTVTLSSTSSQTGTYTSTATRTATPTITLTLQYTATNTPTASPSHTHTPTATITPSFTLTFTATATFTVTPSQTDTPTRSMTPTDTPTGTITSTFSHSPTHSPTLTVTPTPPPPAPYVMTLEIYNSAGERVAILGSGLPLYAAPLSLVEQTGLFIPDDGQQAAILVNGPGTTYFWDGRNDQGQIVEGGSYHVKAQIQDVFGKVTSFQTSAAVLRAPRGIGVKIFNAAGELVWHAQPTGSGKVVEGLSFSSTSIVPGSPGAAGQIQIKWGSQPGQSIVWNGTGNQNRYIESGVYQIQVQALDGGDPTTAQVQVINRIFDAPAAVLKENPVRGSSLGLNHGGAPGQPAGASLYNLAGELVRQGYDLAGAGSMDMQIGDLASGIYLLELEFRDIFGNHKHLSLKVAVVH